MEEKSNQKDVVFSKNDNLPRSLNHSARLPSINKKLNVLTNKKIFPADFFISEQKERIPQRTQIDKDDEVPIFSVKPKSARDIKVKIDNLSKNVTYLENKRNLRTPTGQRMNSFKQELKFEEIPEVDEERNRTSYFSNFPLKKSASFHEPPVQDISEDLSNIEASTSGSYKQITKEKKGQIFTFEEVAPCVMPTNRTTDMSTELKTRHGCLTSRNTRRSSVPVVEVRDRLLSPQGNTKIMSSRSKSKLKLPSINSGEVSKEINNILELANQSINNDPTIKKKINALLQNIEDIKNVLKSKTSDRTKTLFSAHNPKSNNVFNQNNKGIPLKVNPKSINQGCVTNRTYIRSKEYAPVKVKGNNLGKK